jgi:Secretion system C-terminal sorting domain
VGYIYFFWCRYRGIDYVEAINITAFSHWTVGSTASPLPITLARFDAKRISEQEILLTWATASETNNKGFEIEQSENGTDFVKVGFVDGKGNSSSLNNYQLTINNPSSAYYRLKQVDFDGKFEYSPIRFVEGSVKFTVYPNPTSGGIHLQVEDRTQAIALSLSNMQGIALLQTNGKADLLESTLNQAMVNLPAGTYIIQIRQGGKFHTRQIIKYWVMR